MLHGFFRDIYNIFFELLQIGMKNVCTQFLYQ